MCQGSSNRNACIPSVMQAAILGILLFLLIVLLGCCGCSSRPTTDGAMQTSLPAGSWRFIVSGDSRNCGDVVMPSIAAHSSQFSPSFYWHLGDLRAIYKIDEDMAFASVAHHQTLSCDTY